MVVSASLDTDIKEVYAHAAGLQSLSDIIGLSRFATLEFLSLHGNQIECMEGLENLHSLKELNLSSNNIKRMEGLSHLSQLQILNLSCNQIEEIIDVQGLLVLRKLVLSHNRIACLDGLSALHGPRYSLQSLDLRDNLVSSLSELDVLTGCVHLVDLIFSWGSHSNPICEGSAYRSVVVAAAPQILKLDGRYLSSRPQSAMGSQPEGRIQSAYAASLLPLWALQFIRDGQQDALSQDMDAKEFSLYWDAEHSQPLEVFLQSQPQGLRSLNQSNQNPGFQFDDGPQRWDCINPGQVHIEGLTPLVQPYVARSRFQHKEREASWSPGPSPGTLCQMHQAGFNGAPHVQTPTWVSEPSSSHLLSMESLSHPNKIVAPTDLQITDKGLGVYDSSNGGMTGLSLIKQNVTPQKGICKLVLKVDSSSQTSHGAFLGDLEVRILDLVQQLSSMKTAAEGERTGGTVYYPPAKLDKIHQQRCDWRDTFGWQRSQQERSNLEYSKEREDSTAETSDSDKPNSKMLGKIFCDGADKESQRHKQQCLSRRWMHFISKWRQKNELERSNRESSTDNNTEDSAARQQSSEENCTKSGSKLATELDGFEEQTAVRHLCKEVKDLHMVLASTATYRRTEEPPAKLEELPEMKILTEENEKDAKISQLVEDCTLLESQLVNMKENFSEERNDLHKRLEAKHIAMLELEKMLECKDAEVQELSGQMERLEAESRQQTLSIKEEYRGKLISLSTELALVKDALDAACHARQNAESALLDATAEKENCRQLTMSVSQALENGHAKLKVCKSELEACRTHGLQLQIELEKHSKEALDAQTEKQKALEQLSKCHKQEMEEALVRESAAGECRGAQMADERFEELRKRMKQKFLNAQKESQKAFQETVSMKQEMDNLRKEKDRVEAELKATLRDLLLKDQGKEALVIELSSVVRSQKVKLQSVQLDLERLTEAEEDLRKMHQEIIILRRSADKYDDLVLEVETLQKKLIEIAHEAEVKKQSAGQEFHLQLVSMQQENKRLSAALDKLQESEDAVKVKNKMLESQNETIRELKCELSEAKEAFRKCLKSLEALETEWASRLQIEVEQAEDLQSKLTQQALTMTALEEKLVIQRAAKVAAEKTCKVLQGSLTEKEGMFRYIEEEILQVKELYKNRVKALGLERERALEAVKTAQQEKENLEKRVLADAHKREQELREANNAFQTQEAVFKAEMTQKNIQLAEVSEKMREMECKLISQGLEMESQKVASASKLEQLRRLLEEPGITIDRK